MDEFKQRKRRDCAEQYQTCSGPAFRECREKALHKWSRSEGTSENRRRAPSKPGLPDTSFELFPPPAVYTSMIPRLMPIVTAWVRSLAPSLARMFLTWPFTVSSVIASCAPISLFAFPPEIRPRT